MTVPPPGIDNGLPFTVNVGQLTQTFPLGNVMVPPAPCHRVPSTSCTRSVPTSSSWPTTTADAEIGSVVVHNGWTEVGTFVQWYRLSAGDRVIRWDRRTAGRRSSGGSTRSRGASWYVEAPLLYPVLAARHRVPDELPRHDGSH